MGGGEVQLAAVLKHLGGISFVCFELILTERGCNIFEYLSEYLDTTTAFICQCCIAALASEELFGGNF